MRVSRKQGDQREIAPITVKLLALPLEKCINIFIRLCTYTEAHLGPYDSKNLGCILRMAKLNCLRFRGRKIQLSFSCCTPSPMTLAKIQNNLPRTNVDLPAGTDTQSHVRGSCQPWPWHWAEHAGQMPCSDPITLREMSPVPS